MLFRSVSQSRYSQGFKVSKGHAEQCSYKWAFKTCESCGHENDIAARYCSRCRAEIVDPNRSLVLRSSQVDTDPYRIRTANVQMMRLKRNAGRNGKPDSLLVEYILDEKPSTLREWFHPESTNTWLFNRWVTFCKQAFGEELADLQSALDSRHEANTPLEIMYKKKKDSKYFDVVEILRYVASSACACYCTITR